MTSKFSCDLAEDLYDYTLTNDQDEDLGDSETFGWFALFREDGAILSIDSQGFVDVGVPRNLDLAWANLEKKWAWFQLNELDKSCDGLFLILDTARHIEQVPDFEDVVRHIENCETCDSLGNYLEI